jgi:hypothetical protein
MMSRDRITLALISLPIFVVVHGAVSYFIFELAWVSGENGDTSGANTLEISLLMLAPFFALSFCLPLPDAALPVGMIFSSLFWWIVGFYALNYPNYGAEDGKSDQPTNSSSSDEVFDVRPTREGEVVNPLSIGIGIAILVGFAALLFWLLNNHGVTIH